ncbi:uncharacterized protein DUF2332 [Microbacterium sp. SLBN-154]|uniref:DUF2332 domain-containing protein n=1 Tax=Microbacterium sp. SLBN-154 TaxID=2768458 RepID=UPI00114F970F|nr:DUF2332 domain-containing protein [Microbacterium sp. SLBN-154]TQK20543.1 uncharacterized protein DUF2332 [Microbacterium sp. SLBN-154]
MVTTADRYRWHAEMEFRGVSDTYLDWAIGISRDREVLDLIERLPDVKRRAPLLFAAMRFHGAPLAPYADVRQWLIESWGHVEETARARTQQTNEAGRCATLLPALAAIDGPIALLEVGAAAGACLFPDRYGYEYVTPDGESTWLAPSDDRSTVRLRCEINAPDFIPTRLPDVTWRVGIDVNPLSFADADDVEWLRTLVWPEHTERRRRIDKVASMIREDPPRIDRGDATELLPQLAAEAPAGTTLVVFHTAVLAYFPPDARDRFEEAVSALDCIWLSNEGPGSLPSVAARVDRRIGIGSRFVLAKDGIPIALTGGHGQSYDGLTQHT